MKSHHNNHVRLSHHAPPAHPQCQATPAQPEAMACKPPLYQSGPHPLHLDHCHLHPLQASDARSSTGHHAAKGWQDWYTRTATLHSIEFAKRLSMALSWFSYLRSYMDHLPIAHESHPEPPYDRHIFHIYFHDVRIEASSSDHFSHVHLFPRAIFHSSPFFTFQIPPFIRVGELPDHITPFAYLGVTTSCRMWGCGMWGSCVQGVSTRVPHSLPGWALRFVEIRFMC